MPGDKPEDKPEDTTDDTSTDDTTEESDDTSDDSESEEESSDDDSEESDDSEEESDDSDEVESGKKQIRAYFADPKSIPKELRPAFKAMQAQFTRRMQTATASVKKAEAFDQIVADPEFRTWAEQRAARLKRGTNRRTEETEDDSEEDDTDNGKPLTGKALQDAINKGIAKALSPMLKQQQDAKDAQDAANFKKTHPDWLVYKDEILELLDKHPTLSYEEAYDWASGNTDRAENRKRSVESKKKANISKPNKTQGKETIDKNKKMSVMDAYNLAKKMLGSKK